MSTSINDLPPEIMSTSINDLPPEIMSTSINDLPPEILIEICHLASSSRPSNTYALRNWYPYRRHSHIYVLSRRKTPLSFIHVCRYWRMIGISAKSLWSTLCGNNTSEGAFAHWLSFSEPADLHLQLSTPSSRCFTGKRKDEMDIARRRMMMLFGVHSERWGSLAFGICASLCQDLANVLHDVADSNKPDHECPLETLEIELKDDDTPQDAVDSLLSAIVKFKALRHLFWIDPSPNSAMPRIFPWASLKVVYIRASFSFDESVAALMQCTSATDVTLLGTHYSGLRPFISSGHPCTLTHLRTLRLNHRPFDLLKYFTLPSLTTLEVDAIKNPRHQAESQLDAFLNRSQCFLQQFTVQNTYHSMYDDEIVDCLAIHCLKWVPNVKVNTPSSWKQRIEDKILERWDMISLVPRIIHWDGYIGWHEDKPDDAVPLGQGRLEDR